MKKFGFIFLILVPILTVCKKEDRIIDITEQIEFHELITNPCFSGISDTKHDEIVISDNETYQKFGNTIRASLYNVNCDTAILNYIDFSKYTLLGKRTQGGGCSVGYYRNIFDDKTNKKIIYKITVEYSGGCDMLIGNRNWAFIPRLQKGYTVEFQVKQSTN